MKTNITRLYHAFHSPLMSKLVFSSLYMLLFTGFVEGNCMSKLPVIKKELKVTRAFQRILIEGNISVILTNDPAGTVIAEGREKDLNKIRTAFKNNTLIIDGNRKNIFAKLSLYLSASTLQLLQLNGNATISSIDFIKSDYLRIALNGNIDVKVKTTGQISVDTTDDVELVWKSPSKTL